MAIQGVDTKCYILALFIRDDDERFLLGSGQFEFKDTQKQFSANAIQNDVVEVQGNDGYLLAGQVRRSGTQNFDGYVGDGTMAKTEVEENRRKFFAFYQKNHFYRVVYVFPDGTAIQRKRGFLVDDPTVEELYQQYPEYHVALNFEDVNYYSYSENEQGEEEYAKEAIIELSTLRATGGLIWDEYGAVSDGFAWGGETTATGSEITIQNELDLPAPVSDVRLNGDSEQQTYTGKNLLPPPDDFTQNVNGLNIICANGEYTINGNASSGTSTGVKNTIAEYTIQAGDYFHYNNDLVSSRINIALRFSDNTQFANSMNVANRIISLASYVGKTVVGVNVNFNSGYDFSGTAKPMILNGVSTVTPFEPYVGGVPAPNPDYPQDVHVVTGEQTVQINGKNLLNPNTISANTILVWTTGASTSNTGSVTSDYINVASGEQLSLNYMAAVFFYDKNKTLIGHFDAQGNVITTSGGGYFGSFTVPSGIGASYIRLVLRAGSAGNPSDLTDKNIMFNEGNTAIEYEPYQGATYIVDLGSTELCKLGDYQDYIYKSGSDWYIHKEVGQLIFTGAENGWTYDNGVFTENLGGIFSPGNTTPPASNYFTGQTSDNYNQVLDKHLSLHSTSTSGSQRIVIRYSSLGASVDALKTWLSTHNTTVYYPRTTSVDTQITDTDLIDALNALNTTKLFIGENNISATPTGSNLPAELQLKYYTSVDYTGAGYIWEEGGSGGPTIIDNASITNVYPIWTVYGPAVNPTLSVITTNTTLSYTGTVAAFQTLVIDMLNKTAKLNGTSVIGNVSGDWVNFAPGINRIVYDTDNSDTPPSLAQWQEVVG